MSKVVTEIIITNRIEWNEWNHITNKAGLVFLEFLRNKVKVFIIEDAKNEDGDPAFWDVINWVEENANDLWYFVDYTFYFYTLEDAMAFKLRWI